MLSIKAGYAFTQIMKNPDVPKVFSCYVPLNVQDIKQITAEYCYSQYHLREDRDGSFYSYSLEFPALKLKRIKNTRINPEDQTLYKWADFITQREGKMQ